MVHRPRGVAPTIAFMLPDCQDGMHTPYAPYRSEMLEELYNLWLPANEKLLCLQATWCEHTIFFALC